MAFRQCFLRPPEVTKIVYPKKVLQNFKETPNFTRWPKELNETVPRVTYNTGRHQRVPPFSCFRHCETFRESFFSKGPPSFCDRMMLENPKGSLSVFFGIVRVFNFFHKSVNIHQYFDILKSCYFFSLRYGADLGRSRLVCNRKPQYYR